MPFNLQDWENIQPDVFDAEAQFDKEVLPLMNELAAACRRLNLPMQMMVCYANTFNSENSTGSIDVTIPNRTPPQMLIPVMMKQAAIGSQLWADIPAAVWHATKRRTLGKSSTLQ